MYCLTDTQIDYILNDIRARGVEMDGLQQDLLDHVCCIIEQNLEENGDFDNFYSKIIKTFYKKELKEIEEETKSLLTNQHYYTMKKVMIYSGIFSAIVLCAGVVLKFMHLAGAAICIVLSIALLSFVFLPLMFTLKAKESRSAKDKALAGLGALSAMLMTLSVLFKMQHWPGTVIMGYLCIGALLLVFLPVYITAGVRNPETKINTIVSAVIIVCGSSLYLTLLVTPANMKMRALQDTVNYVNSERLLMNEQTQVEKDLKPASVNNDLFALSKQIAQDCEALKSAIIEEQTGRKMAYTDFEKDRVLLGDNLISMYQDDLADKFSSLKNNVLVYNRKAAEQGLEPIPVRATVLEMNEINTVSALESFVSIEMFLLQNERTMASPKLANNN